MRTLSLLLLSNLFLLAVFLTIFISPVMARDVLTRRTIDFEFSVRYHSCLGPPIGKLTPETPIRSTLIEGEWSVSTMHIPTVLGHGMSDPHYVDMFCVVFNKFPQSCRLILQTDDERIPRQTHFGPRPPGIQVLIEHLRTAEVHCDGETGLFRTEIIAGGWFE
ncbi:uncharacterized protein C8R40DRAFT_1073374 [Lentinula edodes]|uniref:uncharacterized protein n=1 Tax=Lentinula edodes TaxID=5353 RepID=UPI001E8CECE1|nr:uncharacterized protein C8R40DRAFT_1073374 [Lentinula edodes]KAH7870310.1 hypothetical protein C8R40DRAFT_1073374 [Lentinula edodes]